ncbi:MAG: hypothetical protein K8S98_03630 [Planctomycetes bacterium]|nr:hypothetical protein [Planctomycetota bacterium]
MSRASFRFALFACLCAGCAKSESDWRAELRSSDPFVRALAAIALVELAPERANDATTGLLETIDRRELALGDAAARSLARAAPFACEQFVTLLVRDDLMTSDRRAAIESALVAAGPRAAETLVAVLRGGERVHAEALGDLLARIGAPAVPDLVALCAEGAPRELENLAARTLGRIGAPARAALPTLVELSRRVEPERRAMVDEAIRRIERGP